jgi:hypothetical protein
MPFQDAAQPGFLALRAEFVEVALDIGPHHSLECGAGHAKVCDAGV